MGQNQPQNTPAAPQDTPTTVGPRVAAARSRKRRTLIIGASCVLAVAVAGTATAAVVVTGGDDTTVATNAAGIPNADPDPLVADDSTPPADPSAADRAAQAASGARQSATATGSDIVEEPEETTEPEEDSSDGSGDAQPTGEGGSCQASFYGVELAGSGTANGETFDPSAMTAAHKSLPFNTMVRVTNTANGSSVTVRINDRGPYIDGRCLDLSTAAFEQISSTSAGVANVSWEVVA